MTTTVLQRLVRDDIWARADELVDRAPSLDALRAHRLQYLAAWLWRERGVVVPAELADDVRLAATRTVAAPVLLKRARVAYPGRLMLMKGLEVAARYPALGSRHFQDLDLLVDEPNAAQRALVSAGFVELQTGRNYSPLQHLAPLVWPGVPLVVEVHRRPNCPAYLTSPPRDELLGMAVPSATGIEGVLAPAPAAHALLLAAHAWAHNPLGRLGDLIDLIVMLPPDKRGEADALAHQWGWDRMWGTVLSAADALLGNGPPTLPLRTWARHLLEVRELSVLENHVSQLAAPMFALPPRQAGRGVALAIRDALAPNPDEHWSSKAYRSVLAARDAFRDTSHHNRRAGLKPWNR